MNSLRLDKDKEREENDRYTELLSPGADTALREKRWQNGFWLHIPIAAPAIDSACRLIQQLNAAAAPQAGLQFHLRFHFLTPPAQRQHSKAAGGHGKGSTDPLSACKRLTPNNFRHGTVATSSLAQLVKLLSCGARIRAEPGSQHAGAVYQTIEQNSPECRSSSPNNHFVFLLDEQPSQLNEHILDYLAAMIRRFLHPRPFKDTFAGLSLGSATFEQRTRGYKSQLPQHPASTNFYTLQQPQARGGLYSAIALSQFLRWYEARCHVLPQLPCTWPTAGESPQADGRAGSAPAGIVPRETAVLALLHMEQALFLMMAELKLTVVYPPPMWEDWLLEPPRPGATARPLPPAQLVDQIRRVAPSRLAVYNSRRSFLHYGPARLYARDTEVMDRCTMVITVFDRHEDVLNHLAFYHTSLNLRSIVVVWNAVEHTPPTIQPDTFWTPVDILRQEVNSMNNRFRPLTAHGHVLSNAPSDCIVNMDDDWNMPHQVLFHASRLWHHMYRDRLVGLWKLARLHGVRADGSWVYLKNSTMPQSMVLPSGMVYHARFLDLYTTRTPARLRSHVDSVINCDDILMNFAVANETRKPPVFVATEGVRRVRVLKNLDQTSGLWHRTKHYVDRDACLNMFTEAYGGMPLRFTTKRFKIDDHLGNPFPQPMPGDVDNASSSEVVCRQCDSHESKDDCVVCTHSR